MKKVIAGTAFLFSVVLAIAAIQVASQSNIGTIEGRVMRSDLSNGIAGVQVVILGPLVAPQYTRSPDLTPDMQRQIDEFINSVPLESVPQRVAAAVARLQAQLLGLPAPAESELQEQGPAPRQVGTLTDGSGHFSFNNLAQGRYQVRAVRDGYFGLIPAGSLSAGVPAASTSISTVITGQPTPAVVLKMFRGGTVSGRVHNSGGESVPGMQVTAYRLGYLNGRARLYSVNSRTGDDRGDYRLYGLPPGEYYIAATPFLDRPASAILRTFFPGTFDGRNAKTIIVKEGAEVPSVDFEVRTESASISGRVVIPFKGPSSLPIPVSTFYLLSADPNALTDNATISLPNSAPNRSDGKFEIRDVPPGVYDLMTSAVDEMGHVHWGRARISVASSGTYDITLTLQPGREVTAQATVDGTPPSYTMAIPPRAVVASTVTVGSYKVPARQSAAGTSPAPDPVPTPFIKLALRSMAPDDAPNNVTDFTFEPAGDYVFRDVPDGHYYLEASPLPGNAYIADVRIGSKSVYDSGFSVGNFTGPIELIVNSNGGRIQGTVLDAANQPFVSARVVLVPQKGRRQNVSLYKTVLSDAMGNFTFTGIAPGEYKLFAWEYAPNTAWRNAEFIAHFEDRGKIVGVSSDIPAKVELKLLPGVQ